MLDLTIKDEERNLRFTVNGGETVYEIPYLRYLPADPWLDTLMDARGKDEEEIGALMFKMFCDLLDEHAPEVRKQVGVGQLRQLMSAWGEGADLGE